MSTEQNVGKTANVERKAGMQKKRVRVLDALRGFSLVSMIAYHTMYDLVVLFGVRAAWYFGWPGYVWQQSICWVFILVSGASMHYGRHTARRGLIVFACAMLLTLVTRLAMPDQLILFGVLHFMGAAMLISAGLSPLLRRVKPLAGAVVSFLLFVLLRGVPQGFIGLLDWPLVYLPQELYTQSWLFWLGLPGPGFASSDYFPLIPWLFLFWTGYFGFACIKDKVPLGVPGKNPLEFLGRHSLLIYMAHQPVIYGVCTLLARAGVL